MEIPFQYYPFQAAGDRSAALPMTFAHANGYPPECYTPLLSLLSRTSPVYAVHLRPLWPGEQPSKLSEWRVLSADLLNFLDQRACRQVIGVGHSVGAIATLRAALLQPQRFAALVLIEPVLMPPWLVLLWQIFSLFNMADRIHPLVKSARRRRQVFANRDEIFKGYRRKSIFRYLKDENLRAYTDALVADLPDGRCQLRFSTDWEAQIYATGVKADMDLWFGLRKLKMPLLIIRGAETDTTWASTARLARLIRPATEVVTLQQSTHLVPLEKPEATVEIIERFLSAKDKRFV